MMKLLRKLLLKSTRVRRAVADYQQRMEEQAKWEYLISAIFRGGSMKL